MIGSSPAIKNVYQLARQVAQSNVSVLISGETGTGKELLAKAIHNNSSRKDEPFIPVNCAAIPKDLIESELFGHEKGAFTGAVSRRIGRMQAADRGTLFLDEIGDLPIELQPKLLRVLQELEIEPVGSNRIIKIDLRVITATHKDLKNLLKKGLFREDLFFRLNVVPLEIPPLRERISDIPLLFSHFIHEQLNRDSRNPVKIQPGVIKALENYRWPGNVRELENLAQRIIALDDDNQITEEDLPDTVFQNKNNQTGTLELPGDKMDLEEWTDKVILQALERNNWNQSKTARYLNISRNQLIYRMVKRKLRTN
jgi:two-component system NtrC family response regulator